MSALSKKHHSGAEWVRSAFKVKMSPFGARVADLLGYVYSGIYHMDQRSLSRVDWSNDSYIQVIVWQSDLSTFDFNYLTKLVFMAHLFCVRFGIRPASPSYLRLIFSSRKRGGDIYHRHPSLEEAAGKFMKDWSGFNFQDGNWMEQRWNEFSAETGYGVGVDRAAPEGEKTFEAETSMGADGAIKIVNFREVDPAEETSPETGSEKADL